MWHLLLLALCTFWEWHLFTLVTKNVLYLIIDMSRHAKETSCEQELSMKGRSQCENSLNHVVFSTALCDLTLPTFSLPSFIDSTWYLYGAVFWYNPRFKFRASWPCTERWRDKHCSALVRGSSLDLSPARYRTSCQPSVFKLQSYH